MFIFFWQFYLTKSNKKYLTNKNNWSTNKKISSDFNDGDNGPPLLFFSYNLLSKNDFTIWYSPIKLIVYKIRKLLEVLEISRNITQKYQNYFRIFYFFFCLFNFLLSMWFTCDSHKNHTWIAWNATDDTAAAIFFL